MPRQLVTKDMFIVKNVICAGGQQLKGKSTIPNLGPQPPLRRHPTLLLRQKEERGVRLEGEAREGEVVSLPNTPPVRGTRWLPAIQELAKVMLII